MSKTKQPRQARFEGNDFRWKERVRRGFKGLWQDYDVAGVFAAFKRDTRFRFGLGDAFEDRNSLNRLLARKIRQSGLDLRIVAEQFTQAR